MIRVREIRDAEELAELKERAAADDHSAVAPTHVVVKGEDDEIVGYLSIGSIPLVNFWMDSENASARDSFYAFQVAENAMALNGVRRFVMPCADKSPFSKLMSRMGFKNLGKSTMYAKGDF